MQKRIDVNLRRIHFHCIMVNHLWHRVYPAIMHIWIGDLNIA